MQVKLTRNEARLLGAVDPEEGSMLYELASAAGLTPGEVREAVVRLMETNYMAQPPGQDYFILTKAGREILSDISKSSLSDPRLKVASSTFIVPEESDLIGEYEDLPSEEVSAALDEEIDKYLDE